MFQSDLRIGLPVVNGIHTNLSRVPVGFALDLRTTAEQMLRGHVFVDSKRLREISMHDRRTPRR
jgi:hypothetical protein